MSEFPPGPHTRAAVPLAPSLDPTLAAAHMPRQFRPLDGRVAWIAGTSIVLAALVALVAQWLTGLIGLVTNLVYYGRISSEFTSPAHNTLGLWAIGIPVLGGLVVGLMARFGSRAIRGHGIPEAMEQVLRNDSRIPPIITWLKPVSSAVAIGTGGPFGAEGPIIATGGALGSLLGQWLHVTADERKTLLAAGAAAGMAAVFAAPVAAVLLAVELLLFERRARSLIPVALAAMVGAGMHVYFEGAAAVFPMPAVQPASLAALATYVVLGALVGVTSVGITRLCYGIEDAFERLPIHWMWWPAIGGLVVGVVGYFMPRTLGVGYDNISLVLGGGIGMGHKRLSGRVCISPRQCLSADHDCSWLRPGLYDCNRATEPGSLSWRKCSAVGASGRPIRWSFAGGFLSRVGFGEDGVDCACGCGFGSGDSHRVDHLERGCAGKCQAGWIHTRGCWNLAHLAVH